MGSGCTFYMESADANAPAAIKENTLYTDFGLYRYYQYFGGGVYVSGTFTMKDGLISGNKALTGSGNGGGGIFNNGVVMLEGGEVSGNSAFFDGEHTGYLSYGGGVFNQSESVLSASGTRFLRNTAMYGGGIYGKAAQITLTGCQIEENAAIFGDMNDCGGGGLLLTRGSTLNISNTLIQGNTSEKDGGGLYLESQDGVTILGSGMTVSGNRAEGVGGGLYNVDSETTLQGVQITGNQATDGAGVANMAEGILTMESGTITGNTSKSTGGGIVNSESTFTMTGGLIYNNTAGDAGADVGNYGGGGDTIFTLPDAADLGIAGVEKWFEDGSQDGKIPRYIGHETEVPSYESFTQNTALHFLTLGEILQVNFDKNGGDTEPVPKEIKVLKGASLGALPASPTKTGSQFVAWNTKSDGSGDDFTDETKVQENLTVFAKWDDKGGSLAVSLTVTGSGAEPGKDFQFTVTLNDKTINGVFGDMTFQDGVATFSLQSGERVVASGLPADVSYSVTQAQVPGYTTTAPANAAGEIQGGDQITVSFVISKGSSETVTPGGSGGTDPTQKPILVVSTLPPATGGSPDGSLGWSLCCLGGTCLLGTLAIPAWKRRRASRP